MNKKIIAIIAVVAIVLVVGVAVFFVVRNNKNKQASNETETSEIANKEENTTTEESNTTEEENNTSEEKEGEQSVEGKYNAEIVVKDYGTIKVELDETAAPITVANFVKLAKEGFYNGLTFHRIISGFMIQGGDPNGDGTGGSNEEIKGEFKNNGVENPISHTRGVISMARSNDPDSASSQFFIMHKDAPKDLDGKYAAFGHVTSGMEVVDQICEKVVPMDMDGTVAKEEQPVIESINIIEKKID